MINQSIDSGLAVIIIIILTACGLIGWIFARREYKTKNGQMPNIIGVISTMFFVLAITIIINYFW